MKRRIWLIAEIYQHDIYLCGRGKELKEAMDVDFSSRVAMQWSKNCGRGDTDEFVKNRRIVNEDGTLLLIQSMHKNQMLASSFRAWLFCYKLVVGSACA